MAPHPPGAGPQRPSHLVDTTASRHADKQPHTVHLKGLLDKATHLLDDVAAAFARIPAKASEAVTKKVEALEDLASSPSPQHALAGLPGISMRQAGDMGKAKPTVHRPSGGPTRPNPNEGRWGQKLDEAATTATTAKTKSEPVNEYADRGDRRDASGRFTENNSGAHTYADYERQGREMYSQQREEAGKPFRRMVEEQRKTHVDGVEQGRFYDGLAQEADGTWTGIENKHGTDRFETQQREFDEAVSPGNPARVRFDTGEEIEVVRVVYTYE